MKIIIYYLKHFLNNGLTCIFKRFSLLLNGKPFIFASVTNKKTVANGYKNGCHDINRDFVRTKIVPAANIVTSILISYK